VEVEPLTNDFVARAQRSLGTGGSLGFFASAVNRSQDTPALASLLVGHAFVGGADGHMFLDGGRDWVLSGGIAGSTALIVDPMLATGGSALAAIALLQQAGVTDIRLMCIVAAPEGIAAVEAAHPALPIFTAAIDRQLDPRKFILPGLGDFGDRLYGTT
jgi:hypothetical protein